MMAMYEFVANSSLELVKEVVTFLTNSANFGAGNEWQLLKPASVNLITENAILKAVGDGQDEIFIGLAIKPSGAATDQVDICINGFAGYDAYLEWDEQPGAITHTTLPTIPMVENTRVECWITANTRRFVLIVQLSTQYECCYAGFFKPIGVERQYPYPMAIGGSCVTGKAWTSMSPVHSCFLNPGSDTYSGIGNFGNLPTDHVDMDNTSLRVRRPDGAWRGGLNKSNSDTALHFERMGVWPQNTEPTNVLTVLDTSLTIENVIMFPCLIYETFPPGIIGQFDGVYFIGNREDIASKDTIIHDNKPYKVFNNVSRRDNDEYFAIEWF